MASPSSSSPASITIQWSRTLESVARAQVVLSLLACVGLAQGYNVALALYTLHASHTQRGRTNQLCFLTTALSFLTDLAVAFLHEPTALATSTRQYTFALALLMLNMLAKIAALAIMYMLVTDLSASVEFPHMRTARLDRNGFPAAAAALHGDSLQAADQEDECGLLEDAAARGSRLRSNSNFKHDRYAASDAAANANALSLAAKTGGGGYHHASTTTSKHQRPHNVEDSLDMAVNADVLRDVRLSTFESPVGESHLFH